MANLTQKDNIVKIEGILSEVSLNEDSFNRKDNNGNDSKVNYIGGTIKVRANILIDQKPTDVEIPVHLFATKTKKNGEPNPLYEAVARIKNEYVSIAASDIDHADRVRITRGQIQMNEYYGPNGNLISFPRITATYVNKIKAEDCKDEASFTIVFMVAKSEPELKDDEETGRQLITGIVPQYGGKVDKVEFVVSSPKVAAAVNDYWGEGDTVKAIGKLNFTSRTETSTVEVDFGEPQEETHTISVSELIITGGSSSPLDGEFAIDYEEVKKALAERKERLDKLKDNAGKKASTPAPANHSKFSDLGF